MEFVPLELSGALTDELRTKYGDGFTFWENLKMGGTGSRKLLFVNGPQEVHDFDDSSVETLQVSFQYLKEALLLRFNIARKISGWIVYYAEIEAVTLCKDTVLNESVYYSKIALSDQTDITLRLHRSDRKHFVKYFSKGPLKDKLRIKSYFLPTPR